jgi:hypothetical protein
VVGCPERGGDSWYCIRSGEFCDKLREWNGKYRIRKDGMSDI